MDTTPLAREITAALPGWVDEVLAPLPETATEDGWMAVVNTLAARNPREGSGGPFAALVVETATGALVSAGVNLVLASGLSSLHAEVTALSLAQRRRGSWDLGAAGLPAHSLVVNWRPCAMCYGAVVWSGVTRLVVAGSGPELEELTGFDEGPVREDWAEQLQRRGIEVVTDVLREEALDVYRGYRDFVADSGATVYNARGTATS